MHLKILKNIKQNRFLETNSLFVISELKKMYLLVIILVQNEKILTKKTYLFEMVNCQPYLSLCIENAPQVAPCHCESRACLDGF